MNDELVERLARAIRTKYFELAKSGEGDEFNEYARSCLAEIEAAGRVIVPRSLLEEIRDSRAGHDWSERGYWYADEQIDNQIREALSASRKG